MSKQHGSPSILKVGLNERKLLLEGKRGKEMKKLAEKEIIEILAQFILENSSDMPSMNLYEKCILKTEEITALVLKEIYEKLKEKQR